MSSLCDILPFLKHANYALFLTSIITGSTGDLQKTFNFRGEKQLKVTQKPLNIQINVCKTESLSLFNSKMSLAAIFIRPKNIPK